MCEIDLSIDKLYKPMAKEIAQIFTADSVIIYFYEFDDHAIHPENGFRRKRLDVKTMWFQEAMDSLKREHLEREERELMRQIARMSTARLNT